MALDPVIKRTLLSLFTEGQRRLDYLTAKYSDSREAVAAAYMAGFEFHWTSNADIDAVQGNITPADYDAVWQEFNQQRQAGLN